MLKELNHNDSCLENSLLTHYHLINLNIINWHTAFSPTSSFHRTLQKLENQNIHMPCVLVHRVLEILFTISCHLERSKDSDLAIQLLNSVVEETMEFSAFITSCMIVKRQLWWEQAGVLILRSHLGHRP